MADTIAMAAGATANRRVQIRRRVLKSAVLRFNNGLGVFEGTVRNQSDRGAMLAFGDTVGVPPLFELSIWGEAAPRPAQVRWRSMTAVGVEFA